MNTEQELRPCPFCGGTNIALVNGGLGNRFAHCDGCRASTDDGSEERAIAAWNRRSSDEQAEVVAWQVTQYDPNGRLYDSVSLVRGSLPDYYRTERWGSSGHAMWEVIPLYRSPPAVAAGGVTDQAVEAACKAFYGEAAWQFPRGIISKPSSIIAMRRALTTAIAVGDEGIREGWQPLTDDIRGPVTVCRFGDADHNWLPMTAYRVSGGKWERPASRDGLPYDPTHWQPLPTPPSRGEGV